jgi:filamentous hemagglutinin
MPDDTPGNRQLLIDKASDSSNYLGMDKYGNEWYAQILPDGRQGWVQVRGNQIRNGGINDPPKPWDPNSGLSAPRDLQDHKYGDTKHGDAHDSASI